MRERPIPFSAPMVRALLAGTKTQTRRVMARQKKHDFTDYTLFGQSGHADDEAERRGGWARPWVAIEHAPDWPDGKEDQCRCPHATSRGDRLWVREAWRADAFHDLKPPRDIPPSAALMYEADGGACTFPLMTPGKLRPPMFMCRWMARTTLEVTDVRVERLHEISTADCRAEGAPGGPCAIPGYAYDATPLEHYRHVWKSINGAGSWDLNPWVWVIEFRRVANGVRVCRYTNEPGGACWRHGKAVELCTCHDMTDEQIKAAVSVEAHQRAANGVPERVMSPDSKGNNPERNSHE